MGILIRGGRVVDAAAQIDKIADVYLDDGVIQKVGEKLEAKDKDDKIIDAKGLVVMPGLVDLHVHFVILDRRRRKTLKPVPMQLQEAV